MTGFAGRINYEGDPEQAGELVRAAIRHANKLGEWKKAQGIDSVTKSFDLGDGNYVTVVDLKHMKVMHIVAPSAGGSSTGPTPNLPAFSMYDGVADVHSGIVTANSIIKEKIEVKTKDGEKIEVEVDALKAFTSTSPTASRFTDLERRRRLAVEEDPMFRLPSALPNVVYSEHAHVVPTMYTGRMRKVAQLLLGIGKAMRPTYEDKWAKAKRKPPLPTHLVNAKTKKAMPDARSAFKLYKDYDASKPVEVKFKFDYRAFRTHGITIDKDGTAWVIEIGNRGVWAMRLYLDPISMTSAGQQRYIDTQPELEEFIKEFGGIPIGTPFPVGSQFERWRKAGEIKELVSKDRMQEFYSKLPYSSAMGWSFNTKGTQAHNTCYSIGADKLKYGFHYKVDISVSCEKTEPLGGARGQLAAMFVDFIDVQKCIRMTETQAKSILKMVDDKNTTGARKAFDAMTVESAIQGTAQLSLEHKGVLYHPSPFKYQPQIKFPEPMAGGLLSFDFSPLEKNVKSVCCDTVMFVCFIDDSLELIKYSYDVRGRRPLGPTGTREYCQFVGLWDTYTPAGSAIHYGNFYSARWDFREEIPQSETRSTFRGTKGPTQGRAFAIDFFAMCILVVSYTYFIVRSKSKTVSDRVLKDSVAIPMQDRNAYYMAKCESIGETSSSESMGIESVMGPQVQYWELYNFVWHWRGSCGPGNGDRGTIKCIAKKRNEETRESCVSDRIPAEIQYSVCEVPGTRGAGWVTTAPLWNNSILGDAFFPGDVGLPTGYSSSISNGGAEISGEIRMINDSGLGELTTKKVSVSGKSKYDPSRNVDYGDLGMSNWWFTASPSESGAVPWMGVTQSCLGPSTVVNYHTDMDGNETKHRGGPQRMHASTWACYTGVTE